VLSFIPGDVPHELPPWLWSESVLSEVARALREWHDATVDFDTNDAVWNLAAREPKEVVCHNDFAPYNCVFRNGCFAGAIDFDVCAPGPRIWDLAYTAYRFVPLMPAAGGAGDVPATEPFPPATMARRLQIFLEAYGATEPRVPIDIPRILTTTADRLEALASWTEEHVRTNGVVALEAHPAMYRDHARWLRSRRNAGLTTEQHALAQYMSSLSEEAYCAGWMDGLEYALWQVLQGERRQYGRLVFTDEHVAELRRLSEASGGWIIFDGDLEETWVSAPDWNARFQTWQSRTAAPGADR
jgi:hypothetical protein